MTTIRIVAGTGTGPTTTAAYDGALLDCGIGQYNLLEVSSVLPPEATIEESDSAPDLGPVGGVVTTVQARVDVSEGERGVAALGWVQSPSGGLFFEATATGRRAEPQATAAVEHGITVGMDRRSWDFDEPSIRTATIDRPAASVGCAVVAGLYGDTHPPAKGF